MISVIQPRHCTTQLLKKISTRSTGASRKSQSVRYVTLINIKHACVYACIHKGNGILNLACRPVSQHPDKKTFFDHFCITLGQYMHTVEWRSLKLPLGTGGEQRGGVYTLGLVWGCYTTHSIGIDH